MEANEFVAKLKATEADSDVTDLFSVHEDCKNILSKLSAKDKGSFALNVLCILCRNLDKVPSWSARIDTKALLLLSIDCVQETRSMGSGDRVKILACVYHIHRHVVRQASSLPPEMVLKLSYMPFECKDSNLLIDYSKTYWNILVDRLVYIEKLKSKKLVIIKLITKLMDDILAVIKIYDTVEFCSKILAFLVKKLYFLYNDLHPKLLNQAYEKIFESLTAKNDTKKIIKDDKALELYVAFNECFYVVAENASKINFKDSALDKAVKTAFTLLGHKSDIFHCLQTFYLNSICSLLTENVNYNFIEMILNNMTASCEATEKLGYKNAMLATYPYLNQTLRLFIEIAVKNSDNKKWDRYFNVQTQENCLKLMIFLMKKLRNSEQLLKCENCKVKAGVHDSLRLSFTVKYFISVPLSQQMDITATLPIFYDIVQEQHTVLHELKNLGCQNHTKCLGKVQTDIHNSAILLNKSKFYEYSIKTFNLYLTNEIRLLKSGSDMKNISRGYYNKSICELDIQLYEESLKSAYLSLLFSQSEGLKTEKHISLVIEIKSKLLKSKTAEDTETSETMTDLQLTTVMDVCEFASKTDCSENVCSLIAESNMCALLRHEYAVYAKLWPSIVPIAGVWKALYDLAENKRDYLNAKDEKVVQTLYEIVLDTPSVVRTIHHQSYAEIIDKLLHRFDEMPKLTAEEALVHSVCLLYKCEYNLAEASLKYGWKTNDVLSDPDQMCVPRTIHQEHAALAGALRAVETLASIRQEFSSLPAALIRAALGVCAVCVPQLLIHSRTAHALQLARVCCAMSEQLGDSESYLRNAGIILHNASVASEQLEEMIAIACRFVSERDRCDETALVFTCQAAMYLSRRGMSGAAAKLLQTAQCRVLTALEDKPELNLELATGALLEAACLLCRDSPAPGALAAATGAHKHYVGISNTGVAWSRRRLRSLGARLLAARAAALATRACVALRLRRRARAAAQGGCGGGGAGAACGAALLARVTWPELACDAQVKIDRIKHILGLPTSDTQPQLHTEPATKTETTTNQLETMLDSHVYQTQSSPSVPRVAVIRFRMPEFLTHSLDCACYVCDTPTSFMLAVQVAGLEAALHASCKEFHMANNYYEGALSMFDLVETKLHNATYKKLGFDKCVVKIVEDNLKQEFESVQIQILIEACYFELAQRNYMNADDLLVRMHEILKDSRDDVYVKHEVLNLICASAKLRDVKTSVEVETGLEREMDNLKLSPQQGIVVEQKTPEVKAERPPTFDRIIVGEEELPKIKRKVIKLNLEDDDKPTPKPKPRKRDFKVPVPITTKPVLETPTPRPKRVKPAIVVTEVTTPQTSTEQCCTPKEEIQEDKFFTPMTSVKTRPKNALRDNLVKNLEKEFCEKTKGLQKEGGNPEGSKEERDGGAEREGEKPKDSETEHQKPKSDLQKESEKRKDLQKEREIPKDSQTGCEKPKSGLQKESEKPKYLQKECGISKSLQVPKVKYNVEKNSLREKRTLRRATSPGPLEGTRCKTSPGPSEGARGKTGVRKRQLRQPTNYSLDDEKK